MSLRSDLAQPSLLSCTTTTSSVSEISSGIDGSLLID